MLCSKGERRLHAALVQSGPLQYLHARRQIEDFRRRMMATPILTQVLEVREGIFNIDMSLTELESALSLSRRSSSEVKFVDWYVPSQAAPETKIIMLVRSLDGSTMMQEVELTLQSIKNWVRLRLDHPAGSRPPLGEPSARARLRELSALVEPLQSLTDLEDLLMLSPSGILNRVPLHALPIGKQTLIERNPIVYVASSAISRHAQLRAVAHITDARVHTQASVFAVYGSDGENGRAERDLIYAHASEMQRSLPFQPWTGDEVTKQRFKQQSATSDWIHYHGHTLFDKSNVLRSCLVLAGGLEEARISAESSHLSTTEVSETGNNLTVSDIFDIDLQSSAPHVTIVGRDSVTQDIALGDEPLGLVSAFMYAGATSVVGTL